MSDLAGGPLGLVSEPLPKDESKAGVPDKSGKDQQQASANESPQVSPEVQKMIESAIAEATKGMVSRDEMELNVGRVRSQLMRATNAERSQWEAQDQAYQEQIYGLTVKDMDENARARFERDLYARRSAELEERQSQIQSELEASKAIGPYLKHLVTGFGVKLDDINLEDVDQLSESAFQAAVKAHQDLRTQHSELERKYKALETGGAHQQANVGETPAAPDVVTKAGGSIDTAPTILDLRKSVSQRMGLSRIITEEELFDLAERPDETGVDLNVVVKAIEAEQANQA